MTTFNRDIAKGARFGFYMMQFMMGCVFWISAASGHFIMSEVVYGAAVAWPAEWWAGLMMVPAGVYLAALFINGKNRSTPYVRAIVGVRHAVLRRSRHPKRAACRNLISPRSLPR